MRGVYSSMTEHERILNRARCRKFRAKHPNHVKQYARKYCKDHPDKVKQWGKNYYAKARKKITKYNKQYHQELKTKLNDIKVKAGCVDCGYNKNPVALDFDHARGKKIKLVSNCRSWVEAEREIKKCEVRCAICHRIATADRRLVQTYKKKGA
jgi:hypothetical protein